MPLLHDRMEADTLEYVKSLYGTVRFRARGAARSVYEVDKHSELIVKIPLFGDEYQRDYYDDYSFGYDFGITQCETEAHIYEHCPEHLKYLLCPIVHYSRNGIMPIIVMLKAIPVLRIYDSLSEAIKDLSCDPRHFLYDLDELMRCMNLSDIVSNESNWGVLDGELVCIDYGMDHSGIEYNLETLSTHFDIAI